jgi:hypothetical protein
MCSPTIEKHGASPINIQWTVIRGDTATLKIEFFEDDESTYFDTSDWSYIATSYDPNGEVLDDLPITPSSGYVVIEVPSSVTENWGNSFKSVVAELQFDLKVTISDSGEDTVWTPVIGTICVLGNVSPGGL